MDKEMNPKYKALLGMLKELSKSEDHEEAHIKADSYLIEALKTAVAEKWTKAQALNIINAYTNVQKWYA